MVMIFWREGARVIVITVPISTPRSLIVAYLNMRVVVDVFIACNA
jgi:hypothetical protein